MSEHVIMQSWAWIDRAWWVHAQPNTTGARPSRIAPKRALRLVRTVRQGDPRLETLDVRTGEWMPANEDQIDRKVRHADMVWLNTTTPAEREAMREVEAGRMRDEIAALAARVAALEAQVTVPETGL